MLVTKEAALAQRAIAEIEQLLYNYDHWGQIESALPLIHQHHRTLKALGHAVLSSAKEKTFTLISAGLMI